MSKRQDAVHRRFGVTAGAISPIFAQHGRDGTGETWLVIAKLTPYRPAPTGTGFYLQQATQKSHDYKGCG